MSTSFKSTAIEAFRGLRQTLSRGRFFKLYAPQSPPAPAGGPLRIAIVHIISNLGDAIMLFPLLDALRQDNPDAEITVFGRGACSVLALHPAVSKLHLYPGEPVPEQVRRNASYFLSVPYIAEMRRVWRACYRDMQFHVCVVPRGGIDPFHSSHLAWMLGGAARVGYSRTLEPERGEHDWGEDVLMTKVVDRITAVHEVQRGAEVMKLAGVLRSEVDITKTVASLLRIAASADAIEFLASHPALAGDYALVAPGASVPRRRWRLEGFAAVARSEFLGRGIRPVLLGSPAETDLCQSVAAMLPDQPPVFTNLSHLQLIALCSRAKALIGNDSAIAHIAGALGVPTVAISAFASCHSQVHFSSLARTHPVGPYVACVMPATQQAPCTTECVATEEHCIAAVTEDAVSTALRDLLSRQAKERGSNACSPGTPEQPTNFATGPT